MSVDRLQRSFLPVTGEAESRTTVALLTDAGVIADQGTPSDDTEALVQNLDAEIAESVAGKRLSLAYEDSGGNERQGVLLPVEYPGAGWAVAVTGSSPTTYGPNRTLLRDGADCAGHRGCGHAAAGCYFCELTARPIRKLAKPGRGYRRRRSRPAG